jgi:hypothetical protein
MISSMTALENLLLTFPPSSIRVFQEPSRHSWRWELSFPSALHVIAVLSPSQSRRMADTVASISEKRPMPPIGFGWQLRLFQDGE